MHRVFIAATLIKWSADGIGYPSLPYENPAFWADSGICKPLQTGTS
jgi:hypothetical protein